MFDDACGVGSVLSAVYGMELVVDVVGIHLHKGDIFIDTASLDVAVVTSYHTLG